MKTLVNLDGYMGDGGKFSVYAFVPVNFGVSLHINARQGLSLGDPVCIKASALYKAFDGGSGFNQSSHAFILFFLNNTYAGTFSEGASRISIADGHYTRGDVVAAFQSGAMKASFTMSPASKTETRAFKLAGRLPVETTS